MSHQHLDRTDGFKSVEIFADQILGIGAYGMVCKAQCDNLPCAAKILHPTIVSERNVKLFHRECQLLSRIKHPNVIRYLGIHQQGPRGTHVLLMELMEENLTTFLERSPTSLPLHTEINLCHDIAMALEYLHCNDIIYRDLSSNNVLLSEGGRTTKVTDFGMARLISTCNDTPLLTKVPGCSLYMPPEAYSEQPKYTEKLDVFSFGVLTIQILTLLVPNPGPSRQKIRDPKYPLPIEVPICDVDRRKNHIDLTSDTHPLRAVILECLSYEEEMRPTAKALCQLLSNIKTSVLYLESAKITACVKDSQKAEQPTLPGINGHSHMVAGSPHLGLPEVKGCGDHSQSSQPNGLKPIKEQTEKKKPEPSQVKSVEHLRVGKENNPQVLLRIPLAAEPQPPSLTEQIRAESQPPSLAEQIRAESQPPSLAEQMRAESQPPSLAEQIRVESQPPSLAEQIRAKSQLISSGSPSLYQIPCSLGISISDTRIAKYDIGIKSVHNPAPGSVLLVVGAKGVRKTELINVLTNHIFGVHMDDPFRFILDSNKEETSWIRAYSFHKMKESPLPFTLTLVDTPGFGDLLHNRKLATQIKQLFSTSGPLGIDRFHGILIVVDAKMMSMQEQIAQALHFCFGADDSTNVFIGVTRMPSDRTNPSVVGTSGWNGVPFDRINTFDISLMFKSNGSSATSEDSILWKREAHKFEVFIKQIGDMKGRSLLLSIDVLAEMRISETVIKDQWHWIQARLIEMTILHQVIKTQTDISCQVTIPEWNTVPLTRGQMAMNCQRCKMTCHFPCRALSDVERDKCCVMISSVDLSLACSECHCLPSDHIVCSHRYVLTERNMASDDIRKHQFQSTYGWRYTPKVQLSELQCTVAKMICQVYCCVREFDNVALKLNPITSDEYLDLLIRSEEQEALPGHAIRATYLEQMKKEVCHQSAAKIKAVHVQKNKLSEKKELEEESRMQREAMRAFFVDRNFYM